MLNRFNKSSRNYVKTICAAVSILVFLCIWQLVVSFTKAGLVLAGPADTLTAFFVSIVHPIGTHTIEGHILWSLSRVLIGFLLGSITGTVLGILMGWFKVASALFRPIFEILRPIPPIAWIPLSIVWFGLGVFSTIVLPSCIPQIFAGLQIAVGTSWATVVAAEMVRSSEGVGWVIVKGQDSNSTVQILVGIVAIGIVGYILAVAMRAIEARLCRWSVRGK